MAVVFPTDPALDDVFYPPDGGAYKFDGEKWVSVVPNPDYANIAGPQGATGPKGDQGDPGFVPGEDATIGTLTVAQVDIEADLNITDGTSTKYTFSRTSGDFTATGDVTAFSDARLKKNIESIPAALEKVSAINGVTYERTDLEGVRQAGVLAQEVEAVLPEVVLTNEEGIKSVAYGNLVGLLIEAIKELKEEVETLKEGN